MKKSYKKPDVKAPRFRQKGKVLVTDTLINKFKKKYPKYKDITKVKFNNIIKLFNEEVWSEVIENRDGVQLPEGIGYIFIGSCKNVKKYNFDFKTSSEYNTSVENKNWETDGNVAKIFYSSYSEKYHYKNRECWNFFACRNFKRSVSEEYPKRWTMYHEVNPHKKINEQFVKMARKEYAVKKTELDSKNYKDFEI